MKKIKFQKRLLLYVFALLAILIILCAFVFCAFAMVNVRETERSTLEQISERVSLQVDAVYRQMGIAATATVTNPQLKAAVFDLNTNIDIAEYDKLQYASMISANMTTNLFYLSEAQNAFLYNARQGYFYYTGLYLWDSASAFAHAKNTEDYDMLLQKCSDSYYLRPPHINPWKKDGDAVISVAKRFFENDKVENAIFEVQLPYSVLEYTCRQDSFDSTRQILIFDSQGNLIFPFGKKDFVISDSDISRLKKDVISGMKSDLNSSYLFASSHSDYTDWCTVLVSDPVLLHKQFAQYLAATALFVLLVGGATLAVLAVLTRRLTKPLNDLADKVRNVSLDKLDVDFGAQTPDELTALDESFQAMFQKLHTSVQEVYEMRIRESNAHLHALQSQINPHFLYNTLNSIGAAARIYGGETATEMCQSLANMMRYVTAADSQNTLAQEITHTQNYLSLCQIPYGESFSYSVNIPPEMYRIKIPKLTLQPIVENSVSHGFSDSTPPFIISVNGSIRNDGRWCLVVTDNGCGFPNERITELKAFLQEHKSVQKNALDTESLDIGGLGLKNIFTRLFIVFDNDIDFEFINNEVGCSVIIIGPLLQGDTYD